MTILTAALAAERTKAVAANAKAAGYLQSSLARPVRIPLFHEVTTTGTAALMKTKFLGEKSQTDTDFTRDNSEISSNGSPETAYHGILGLRCVQIDNAVSAANMRILDRARSRAYVEVTANGKKETFLLSELLTGQVSAVDNDTGAAAASGQAKGSKDYVAFPRTIVLEDGAAIKCEMFVDGATDNLTGIDVASRFEFVAIQCEK